MLISESFHRIEGILFTASKYGPRFREGSVPVRFGSIGGDERDIDPISSGIQFRPEHHILEVSSRDENNISSHFPRLFIPIGYDYAEDYFEPEHGLN